MTKDELEILKKLKEVMLSFKGESPKSVMGYSLGKNDFSIVENDKERLILLYSATQDSQEAKRLTDEETFSIVEDYFKNGGKPLEITIHGKVRFNSILNIMIKKQVTGEFRDMVVNAFFTVKDNDVYEGALEKINKSIKDKSCDATYGHDLAFKILSRIGRKGKIINSMAFSFSTRFPAICSQIEKLKVTENDYPVLHNMFRYFEDAIEKDYNSKNAFNKLLKQSIPPKDWAPFKVYLKEENSKKPQSKSMFEEKPNPKFHLNINEDFVTSNYPSVSLSTDYINMISAIIGHIRDFKDTLGLESCHNIAHTNKITSIYFLSKDEKPVDGEKIKKIFESMIGLYAEMTANKTPITKEAMHLAMRANILAFELENGKNNEENQRVRKPNKI